MTTQLPTRPVGSQGMKATQQGLGCMGLSMLYNTTNPVPDEDLLKVIRHAGETGVNFLDTAEVYGPYINEQLISQAIKDNREKWIVATKFGIYWYSMKSTTGRMLDATPDQVFASVEGSLQRLGTTYIDLYYLHRKDPDTPIEDTVGALKQLVEQGKIRYIGLSECSAEDIRRAHAVHPVTAVQLEWSLWARDVEDDVVPVCRELGIGIVAYSPLGRGFLTGTFTKPVDLNESDWRLQNYPRMRGDNFQKNMYLVDKVKAIAAKKGCTPSQVALAWLHQQGEDVFPIPGTKRIKYLDQNIASYGITLTSEEIRELDFRNLEVHGDRYDNMEVYSYHYGKTNSTKEVAA